MRRALQGPSGRTFDFFLRMAVTSEFTTGNLAPTAPSFVVMSVNSVRCAASDDTACHPRAASACRSHAARAHSVRAPLHTHRLRLPNDVVQLRG
jgi:hypothetical protein